MAEVLEVRREAPGAHEIETAALCYLLNEVGDRAGITPPEWRGDRWRVPVVLLPEGQPLGALAFNARGELMRAESTTADALAGAADLADPVDAG